MSTRIQPTWTEHPWTEHDQLGKDGACSHCMAEASRREWLARNQPHDVYVIEIPDSFKEPIMLNDRNEKGIAGMSCIDGPPSDSDDDGIASW